MIKLQFNVRLILHLHYKDLCIIDTIFQSQPCSSYKCQLNSILIDSATPKKDLCILVRYLLEVNCVQATNISLVLHFYHKDLCIIDKYLPNFNCVQATNFKLILHLHYWDLCIIDRYLPKFDSV